MPKYMNSLFSTSLLLPQQIKKTIPSQQTSSGISFLWFLTFLFIILITLLQIEAHIADQIVNIYNMYRIESFIKVKICGPRMSGINALV